MKISASGAWLLEDKPQASQRPISVLFEGCDVSVSCLLPYAPEDLQCTVCFTDLLVFVLDTHRTVRTCSQGHLLCTLCWRRVCTELSQCPTCRDSSFHPVPLLRQLALNSFNVCPFGCGLTVWGHGREKHLNEECPDRPCVCPICEADCKAKSFLAHCQTAVGHFSDNVSFPLSELQGATSQKTLIHKESFLLKLRDTGVLHFKQMMLENLPNTPSPSEQLLSIELQYFDAASSCSKTTTVLTRLEVQMKAPNSEFTCQRQIALPAWDAIWSSVVVPSLGDERAVLSMSFQ